MSYAMNKHALGLSIAVGSFLVFSVSLVATPTKVHAATPDMSSWQQAIHHLPIPGEGCFTSSYPAIAWESAACHKAPKYPQAPGLGHVPMTVGNGTDYSAQVSGLLSSVIGSFPSVSSGISETGQVAGSGPQKPNTFTLQLNSSVFSASAQCSTSANPDDCSGWQQFVYDTNTNSIFMQYWLLNYGASCPPAYSSYEGSCFTNSNATTLPGSALTAAGLSNVTLEGTAQAPTSQSPTGLDSVILTNGGVATAVSEADVVLDLASSWNTAEFGVFGDGDGGEANFSANTTLLVKTATDNGTEAAPSCSLEGFTGETNNLNLVGTPQNAAGSVPAIVSEQSNAVATPNNCVAAPVAPPGAPTIGAATPGYDGDATVSFEPPSSTGGAPITQYEVSALNAEGVATGVTATGTASPIVVSGLTDGDNYTFEVNATNSAGTGPYSSPSNMATPGEQFVAVEGPQNSLDVYVQPIGSTSSAEVVVAGPGTTYSAPVLVPTTGTGLDIAVQGPKHKLYFYWSDSGSTWNLEKVSGVDTSYAGPSIAFANNRTWIVTQGENDQLELYWQVNGTPTWNRVSVAGTLTTYSAPVITPTTGTGLNIAAQGPKHKLYFYWSSSGTTWNLQKVSGIDSSYSEPAITFANDRTLIATQGPSNDLQLYWQTAGTGQWNPVSVAGSGSTYSTPGITMTSGTGLNIAAQGQSQSLEFYWSDDSGSSWNPQQVAVSGNAYSSPTINEANASTNIVVQGSSNTLGSYSQVNGDGGWQFVPIAGSGTTYATPSIGG